MLVLSQKAGNWDGITYERHKTKVNLPATEQAVGKANDDIETS